MQMVVDNVLISYEDRNDTAKESVLFLHGWGSNKETFSDLMDDLSQLYRCVSVDYPGFGQSDMPAESWGIPEYSEFVLSFLRKLECQPSVIIGHSMGGRIAVYLTGTGELQDTKLVLLGAAGFKESTTAKNQVFKVMAKGGKLAAKPLPSRLQNKLKTRLYSAAGSTDYLNSGAMQETFRKIIDLDLSELADRIENQTLLIYGELDDQTPPSYGARYNELMKNSTFKQIKDAGHYVHIDAADQVHTLIGDFLS